MAAKASQACVPASPRHRRQEQQVPAAYLVEVEVAVKTRRTGAPSAHPVAEAVAVALVAQVPDAGMWAAISPFHTHSSKPEVVVVPPLCPTALAGSHTVANLLRCTLTALYGYAPVAVVAVSWVMPAFAPSRQALSLKLSKTHGFVCSKPS